MDNTIVVEVALVLFGMMRGVKPEELHRQQLLAYFSRFASFPQGLILSDADLGASRALLATRFGEHWQAVFDGFGQSSFQPSSHPTTELTVELAEQFVREYVQSLFSFRQQQAGSGPGIYCGETVTDAHNILDHVSHHQAGSDQWVLHLTTEGECLMGGAQPQLLKVGQLVLMAPDYACDYQRAPSCSRWVHRWLRFSVLPEWLQWSAQLRARDTLSVAQLAPPMFESVYRGFVDVLMLSGQGADEALLRNRTEYILRVMANSDREVAARLDDRVQRAMNYVTQRFNQSWSMDELAAECHLSTARLAALFKQQLGVSPVQWRDQLRMREARRLLSAGTQTITAVAEQLGYSDPLHFSRRFRQLVGVSPRDYRARV